ncbi:MAG: hypothetical protein ACREYF_00740 [Gammaproteobacteria bacterium]
MAWSVIKVGLEAIDADGKPFEVPDLTSIVRDLDQSNNSDFGLKLS